MKLFQLTILSIALLSIASCEKETKRMKGFAVHGIDVSHYQNQINWDTVAEQNINFVFIKASEGESIQDSLFQKNWNSLKKFDIKKGAYHFFRPGTDVKNQFANFKQIVKLEQGDLPPVLDIEVNDGVSKLDLVQNAKSWLSLCEEEYKIKPIIYTNLNFYKSTLAGYFDDYPLWIARYSNEKPILNYGNSWTFWQYGNRGQIRGIDGDVDFNVFNGSLEDLEKLSYKSPYSQIW